MPSVPLQSTSTQPRQTRPANPNVPPTADTAAHVSTKSPSHQPSPAVIDTASHKALHVLPRRFLGPLPPSLETSSEVRAKRSRLHRARAEALHRIHGAVEVAHRNRSSNGALEGPDEGRIRGGLNKIRIRKRGTFGHDVEEEIDFDMDDMTSEHNTWGRKHKGKGKAAWIGESFDIGREFIAPTRIVSTNQEEINEEEYNGNAIAGPSSPLQRPKMTPRSTQETFVTARTQLSSVSGSSRTAQPTWDARSTGADESSYHTTTERVNTRRSNSSSTQPLLSENGHAGGQVEDNRGSLGSAGLKRLKSAIRRPSNSHTTPAGPSSTVPMRSKVNPSRSKSVSFPVELVHTVDGEARLPQGNKPPADPDDVLAREGQEAEGTSAGAQEAALNEDLWDDEEVVEPGDIILRDRMLVKVGYHRDEGMDGFDEAKQRRSPCSRMERMEEYIVVMRRDRIELYQDWSNPIRARLKKTLRLCFVIVLAASRSTLSIFNEVDMTLCLTTSASKLQSDLERSAGRQTTRSQAIKTRFKESKQGQWLSTGRRGTHVFVMKLGERSRAMDWYWEIWRELGGELPTQFDIEVPALSTSVRIKMPQDDVDIGGRLTQKQLNPRRLIDTCWDMVSQTIDVQVILDQKRQAGDQLDLELAWKGVDGVLEWVAWSNTVQNRIRDWAVLAGVAKLTGEKMPRILQLRLAHHQPKMLKLETGSVIQEPPGVEGYLTRHKSGSAPKEQVYVASHDGNIYTASMSYAKPPLPPQKESSTPKDLFPEVYREFTDGEKKRMARFIEKSAGCIDLRSIDGFRLCSDIENDIHIMSDDKRARSFEVMIKKGPIRMEAQSSEVAREWVERLTALMDYWKRRHRVDARLRMDAMTLHGHDDPFAGTQLSNSSDAVLSDIWDWCTISGCREICLSGRIFLKKKKTHKFKSRYLVLTGGSLVTFKVKIKQTFYPRQHHYPLFGAYVYSGMLAQDEVREAIDENALGARSRVYQDGLQSSDGAEDTTFCVRILRGKVGPGGKRQYPWEVEDDVDDIDGEGGTIQSGTVKSSVRSGKKEEKKSRFYVPPLTDAAPQLLVFRARSKLERDRWVWALNAEMERQVRANLEAEDVLRHYGNLP